MKSIYARFVLWLIRPALEKREAERVAVSINTEAIGQNIGAAVRQVIAEERRPGGVLN